MRNPEVQDAKDYAYRLLKFRLRSESELLNRLKRKKFSPEAIKQAIRDLKKNKLIDDRLFAKTWVESRIKMPLGFNRLRQELRFKGISEELIAAVIEQARQRYDQAQTVNRLAKEKFMRLKDLQPNKAKRRIYAYFLRRGFSPEIVIDAINQL